MTTWPITIATSLAGFLTGGAGVAVVNAFAKRRTFAADAEVRLSDEARQWVEQFQEEAKEARTEAREARHEAAEARREATEAHAQMRVVRAEAQWLAGQLQALRREILAPGATLERLRAIVGPEASNGTGG